MKKSTCVLGIESSCDETSVALLDDNGIIANEIFSQKEHMHYGGVVPEIASRAHIQKIDRLCRAVFERTGTTPADISLLAVTDSPGLAGALLVGVSFALGMHCSYGIPIIGVNHLAGHIASVTLEHPQLQFPFLALVVSGGHTALYQVDSFGDYRPLGQTIDDAAGEAFDKVGKLLGMQYPAGRAIELEAKKYGGDDRIPFPVARLSGPGFNFSFSGLKTAVKYHLEQQPASYAQDHRPLICRSFQDAVLEALLKTTRAASRQFGLSRIAVVGGVACNETLRAGFRTVFNDSVFFPSIRLCTDNAAMIAKAGYEHYRKGLYRFPKMEASPSLRMTALTR